MVSAPVSDERSTVPVEVRLVNVPAPALLPPIVTPSIAPPLMSTVPAVKVPESVSSERAMPESRRASSEEDKVAPPTVISFEPNAKAVLISASERSNARPIVDPEPEVPICKRVATSPVEELSNMIL